MEECGIISEGIRGVADDEFQKDICFYTKGKKFRDIGAPALLSIAQREPVSRVRPPVKCMHMMKPWCNGAKPMQAFLQRTAMLWLPERFDKWMVCRGQQFGGGVERIGERVDMELVAKSDVFFGSHVGATQGIIDNFAAPVCVGIR